MGGGVYSFGSVVTFANALLADNTPQNCAQYLYGDPIPFGSAGNNIDSDGSCDLNRSTDIEGVDPQIAPLRNYGGDTLTHALPLDSIAVDAGNPTTCTQRDQRGVPRDSRCDIGAFEASRLEVPLLNVFQAAEVSLSWMPVGWAAGYQVEISRTSSFSPVLQRSPVTDQLAFTFYLPLEGTYFWRVRAVKAQGGVGVWTMPQSFTIATP